MDIKNSKIHYRVYPSHNYYIIELFNYFCGIVIISKCFSWSTQCSKFVNVVPYCILLTYNIYTATINDKGLIQLAFGKREVCAST